MAALARTGSNQIARSFPICAPILLLSIALLAISCTSQAQELDETRQFRVSSNAPLNWENVTRNEQYIRGIEPTLGLGRRISTVDLAPGQAIEFLVPSHELVRVVGCDSDRLTSEDIEIWNSNGSGLFRKLNSALTKDGHSLLSAPNSSSISTTKVLRPEGAADTIRVAIYTSRRSRPKLLDYYQCPIEGLGATVKISDDVTSTKQVYALLGDNSNCEVPLNGPQRLRLETRLKYGSDPKQRQSYWIQVYVDGILHRVYTFDTAPQKRNRVFVDGCEKLVGRREFAYVDIDRDAKVEIRSSHSVYLRVDAVGLDLCHPQLNRNLDLPTWQNSQKSISNWNVPEFDPASAALSQSFLFEEEVTEAAIDPLLDPYLNQHRIQQVARNNRIEHGGLRAYMWMRALAALHYGDPVFGDEISVPAMANRIRERYTGYRDLLPIGLSDHREPKKVSFPIRRIRDAKSEKLTETIVGEQHVGETLRWLPKATLFRCSTGADPAIRYRVPDDIGDTLLRVVIDQTHLDRSSRLMIQYDDRQPIQLAINCHESLPLSAMVPSRAEAAIACLGQLYNRYDSGPFGGPFSIWATPTPIISAATDEFLLPGSVKEVKIWIESKEDVSLHIGLQYLDAQAFQLSETSYRRIAQIEQQSVNPAERAFAAQELDNHSFALQQLLIAHSLYYSSSVEPSEQIVEPTDLWEAEQIAAQIELAESLGLESQWPAAIEALSDVINHSNGDSRRSAILARIHALQSMGERFLAQTEMRGWLQYSGDPALRASILELLVQNQDGANGDQLERSLAFINLQGDQETYAVQLARQLMENGKFDFALQVLPSLTATPETENIILRCSFQARWWHLFDETVNAMTDPQSQSLWKGLKKLQMGNFRDAHGLIQLAGEQGLPWLRHWEQGHLIFQRLSSRNFATRMSALEDWEAWQLEHPGHRHWKNHNESIQECVGTRTLHHKIRNIDTQFYIATQETPGQLCIHGPTRIRLECRPLHQSTDLPIRDWLQIVNGQSIERVPILNNFPSRMLEIKGGSTNLPGDRVITEVDLPAGLHCLQVSAEHSNILFRVQVERPEIQSPVLPVINDATLTSVVKGDFGQTDPCCSQSSQMCLDQVRLICRASECCSVALSYLAIRCDCQEFHTAKEFFLKTATGETRRWRDRFEPTFPPIVVDGIDEVLSDAIEHASVPQSDYYSTPDETMLAIANLYRLAIENPGRAEITGLLNQTKSGATWERFSQFDRQAGIHTRSISTWQPESPNMRVRKALSSIRNARYVVNGRQPLEVLFQNDTLTNIQMTAQRPRVSFLPVAPSQFDVVAEDQSTHYVLDDPNQIVEAQLDVPLNAREFAIQSTNPLSNHFVAIQFQETLPDGQPAPLEQQRLPAETQRVYQVSTQDEPLEFRVAGPTVIRIDWIQDGQTWTDTIPVTDEETSFRLTPQGDEEVTHFRIFELTLGNESVPSHRPLPIPNRVQNDWVHDVVEGVYEQVSYFDDSLPIDALSLRPPDVLPAEVSLEDGGQLGLQELGTWSLSLGFRERRALDEFPNPSSPGRFMEGILRRNKYHAWSDHYSQSDFVVRPRLDGGTTFGIRHGVSTTLPWGRQNPNVDADGWSAYQVDWSLSAFTQNAGTPILPGSSSTPWSVGFNGKIARRHQINDQFHHQPSVSYFGRLLSEDVDGFAPGDLDQDIFTQYKADHRYGLRFSDRLVYQSCLDRRWWLRSSIATNEDQLVPDNLGFQIGTDQLLGPLQLQLAYRLTGYLADNDRGSSSVQNVIDIHLGTERWHHRNHRSELKFAMRHDLGNGGTSIGFNLVSFFNHGRGYQDFNSTPFRSIRQERAALQDSP